MSGRKKGTATTFFLPPRLEWAKRGDKHQNHKLDPSLIPGHKLTKLKQSKAPKTSPFSFLSFFHSVLFFAIFVAKRRAASERKVVVLAYTISVSSGNRHSCRKVSHERPRFFPQEKTVTKFSRLSRVGWRRAAKKSTRNSLPYPPPFLPRAMSLDCCMPCIQGESSSGGAQHPREGK